MSASSMRPFFLCFQEGKLIATSSTSCAGVQSRSFPIWKLRDNDHRFIDWNEVTGGTPTCRELATLECLISDRRIAPPAPWQYGADERYHFREPRP